MNENPAIHTHKQLADLIAKALTLCEVMLSHAETLYPFANVYVNGHAHCVSLEDQEGNPNDKMIERLQQKVSSIHKTHPHSIALLAYCITLQNPEKGYYEAILLNVTDALGNNSMTIYPYEFEFNGIKLGEPYTCGFQE